MTSRAEQTQCWPVFAGQLQIRERGPVYAVPLRLRDHAIGALNLFRAPECPLPEVDLRIGKALADVATNIATDQVAPAMVINNRC